MALRRFLRVFGLGLAGFAAAVLIAEIALRLIAVTPLWRLLPVVEVSLYGPDPATGYTHRPGVHGIWRSENRATVAINAQGFRGPMLPRPKPAGETRIAIIGDSFVEALQVEDSETFVRRTERLLRAGGGDVRVANFGLSGASPAVQRERLAAHVVGVNPDIVILMPRLDGFFDSRASDDSAFPAWVATADGGIALRHGFRDTAGYRFRTSAAGAGFYWLLDHIQLAGLLNNRKNAGFLPMRPPAAASVAAPENPCDAVVDYWRNLAGADAAIGWQRIATYLRDVAALGLEHGFRPLVMMYGLNVDPPSCRAEAATAQSDIMQRLATLSAATGVRVYDIEKLIAEHLPPGTAVSALHGFGAHAGHGHLNGHGHAVYAAALADILAPLLLRESQ